MEVAWGVVLEAARNPAAALIADLRERLSTGDGDLGAKMEEPRKKHDAADEAVERVARYCQALSDKPDDWDLEGKRATPAALGVRFEATRKTLSITVTVDPNCTTIEHTWA